MPEDKSKTPASPQQEAPVGVDEDRKRVDAIAKNIDGLIGYWESVIGFFGRITRWIAGTVRGLIGLGGGGSHNNYGGGVKSDSDPFGHYRIEEIRATARARLWLVFTALLCAGFFVFFLDDLSSSGSVYCSIDAEEEWNIGFQIYLVVFRDVLSKMIVVCIPLLAALWCARNHGSNKRYAQLNRGRANTIQSCMCLARAISGKRIMNSMILEISRSCMPRPGLVPEEPIEDKNDKPREFQNHEMNEIQARIADSGAFKRFVGAEFLALKYARVWLCATLLAGLCCFFAVTEVLSSMLELYCPRYETLAYEELSRILQDITIRLVVLGFPFLLTWICATSYKTYREEAILNRERIGILQTSVALMGNTEDRRTLDLMIQDAIRSCLASEESLINAVSKIPERR